MYDNGRKNFEMDTKVWKYKITCLGFAFMRCGRYIDIRTKKERQGCVFELFGRVKAAASRWKSESLGKHILQNTKEYSEIKRVY